MGSRIHAIDNRVQITFPLLLHVSLRAVILGLVKDGRCPLQSGSQDEEGVNQVADLSRCGGSRRVG